MLGIFFTRSPLQADLVASPMAGYACFFYSEITASTLIASGFSVNGHFVEVRRLDTQSRKVVLSNVPPELPDSMLLDSLAPLGKITSRLTCLGASLKNPSLKHVKSFRRSVFMQITNENAVPHSVPISFEGRNYTVFLTLGDITCFHCHAVGHMKSKCLQLLSLPTLSASLNSQNESAFPPLSEAENPPTTNVSAHEISLPGPSTVLNDSPTDAPNSMDKDSIDNSVPLPAEPMTSDPQSLIHVVISIQTIAFISL